jgi:hypothetical protein
VFTEAKARGVKKRMVNHPTYMVGASDADIRDLAAAGVAMEHSICMFVEGRSKRFSAADLKHLIDTAGVDKTILSSDLGLGGCVRPVEGFRAIAPRFAAAASSSAAARGPAQCAASGNRCHLQRWRDCPRHA